MDRPVVETWTVPFCLLVYSSAVVVWMHRTAATSSLPSPLTTVYHPKPKSLAPFGFYYTYFITTHIHLIWVFVYFILHTTSSWLTMQSSIKCSCLQISIVTLVQFSQMLCETKRSLIPFSAVIFVLVIWLKHHWLCSGDWGGRHHQVVCRRVRMLLMMMMLEQDIFLTLKDV